MTAPNVSLAIVCVDVSVTVVMVICPASVSTFTWPSSVFPSRTVCIPASPRATLLARESSCVIACSACAVWAVCRASERTTLPTTTIEPATASVNPTMRTIPTMVDCPRVSGGRFSDDTSIYNSRPHGCTELHAGYYAPEIGHNIYMSRLASAADRRRGPRCSTTTSGGEPTGRTRAGRCTAPDRRDVTALPADSDSTSPGGIRGASMSSRDSPGGQVARGVRESCGTRTVRYRCRVERQRSVDGGIHPESHVRCCVRRTARWA